MRSRSAGSAEREARLGLRRQFRFTGSPRTGSDSTVKTGSSVVASPLLRESGIATVTTARCCFAWKGAATVEPVRTLLSGERSSRRTASNDCRHQRQQLNTLPGTVRDAGSLFDNVADQPATSNRVEL